MRYFVTIEGEELAVDVVPLPGGGVDVRADGVPVAVDLATIGDSENLVIDGGVIDLTVEGKPPQIGVLASGTRVYLEVESDRFRAARAATKGSAGAGDGAVVSPMPGRVLKILVQKGDAVAVGQPVAVVEAMKMENELKAQRAGVVSEISVDAGATVEAGAKLVTIA